LIVKLFILPTLLQAQILFAIVRPSTTNGSRKMNAHDSWLERPYAEQDKRDAEFTKMVGERTESIIDDLRIGNNTDDAGYVMDDPGDFLRQLLMAALQTGVSDDEIAADVRSVISKEAEKWAKYLVEREQ
jgi:hypothetical protein